MGFSKRWLSFSTESRSNWNLEGLFFWREENQRVQRKTLGVRTRTNNKLSPHVTPGPGIEPRPQWWEVRTLTTARYMFPQINQMRLSYQKLFLACLIQLLLLCMFFPTNPIFFFGFLLYCLLHRLQVRLASFLKILKTSKRFVEFH